MIDIIKENVDKEIKDKAISKYEDKLKEIDNFVSMSNNDIDYIIEDNVMKLFQ